VKKERITKRRIRKGRTQVSRRGWTRVGAPLPLPVPSWRTMQSTSPQNANEHAKRWRGEEIPGVEMEWKCSPMWWLPTLAWAARRRGLEYVCERGGGACGFPCAWLRLHGLLQHITGELPGKKAQPVMRWGEISRVRWGKSERGEKSVLGFQVFIPKASNPGCPFHQWLRVDWIKIAAQIWPNLAHSIN
jgi:hypothetical protein